MRVGPNGYCRRPAVLVVERAGAGAVVDGAEGPLVDGVVEASIADTASQDGAFLVGAAAADAVVDVKAGHQLSRTGKPTTQGSPAPDRTDPSPGNRAALAAYTGESKSDPTLAARLSDLTVPTLVLWGANDQNC